MRRPPRARATGCASVCSRIGDDYWIEHEDGSRAFRVDGKALRIRQTFVLEDATGREVAKLQERKLSVIVAGALGAIVGDSMLFWIARRNAHRIRPQLERAQSNARVTAALEFMGENHKVLLTLGRYVPGLRFVANATMGLSDRPYREFLPRSVLGGVLWSSYTCLLAYWIGSTLEDYPLASVVISGVVTTAIMGLVYLHVRHCRRAGAHPEKAPTGVA